MPVAFTCMTHAPRSARPCCECDGARQRVAGLLGWQHFHSQADVWEAETAHFPATFSHDAFTLTTSAIVTSAGSVRSRVVNQSVPACRACNAPALRQFRKRASTRRRENATTAQQFDTPDVHRQRFLRHPGVTRTIPTFPFAVFDGSFNSHRHASGSVLNFPMKTRLWESQLTSASDQRPLSSDRTSERVEKGPSSYRP
jgi:hypothetical protein